MKIKVKGICSIIQCTVDSLIRNSLIRGNKNVWLKNALLEISKWDSCHFGSFNKLEKTFYDQRTLKEL